MANTPIMSAELEMKDLIATLRQIAPEMKKTLKTLVKSSAKLALRKAVEMTPPGESGMSAREAKKRGENAILTDSFGGRRGAEGKTKRSGIFFVANESLLRKWERDFQGGQTVRLFVKKDGTVWATEKRFYKPSASIQEMNSHHGRYWKNGRMSSGGTRDQTIGRHVFIDRMVVGKGAKSRYLAARYKRVGYLAAGWMPAVRKLRVSRIPKWVSRHAGAPGSMTVREGRDTFMLVMTNSVKYAGAAQLKRIVPHAIRAARLGMIAQAKHIRIKRLQKGAVMITAATGAAFT